MKAPNCPACGMAMRPRDMANASEEQKWCGTWFQCSGKSRESSHDTATTIIKSAALEKQLAGMRA